MNLEKEKTMGQRIKEPKDFLAIIDFTHELLAKKRVLKKAPKLQCYICDKERFIQLVANQERHLYLLGGNKDNQRVILKVSFSLNEISHVYLYGILPGNVGQEWRDALRAKYDNCYFQFVNLEFSMTERGEIVPSGFVDFNDDPESGICPFCEKEIAYNLFIHKDPKKRVCSECNQSLVKSPCSKCGAEEYIFKDYCSHCENFIEVFECQNCHNDIIVNSKECPYCGQKYVPCPHCQKRITESCFNEDVQCPECDGDLTEVKCPHCHKKMFNGLEKCPHCGKELEYVDCPDCYDTDILVRERIICHVCETEFKKCPHCGDYIDKKRFSDDEKYCFECNGDLHEITCPFCKKKTYNALDNCTKCGHELGYIDCPECEEAVTVGVTTCPNCKTRIRK